MKSVIALTKRNVLIFLRDKAGVFFSLLAPLLVLLLFVLFLGDIQINSAKNIIEEYAGINAVSDSLIKALVNSWMLSGVLGVGCITVSFSAVGILISDREAGVNNDYVASPISKVKIYLAYFLGIFFITAIIMMIVAVVGLIFLAATKSFKMDFLDTLMLFLSIILGSASASLLVVLLTAFIKTQSAHSAFTGIICATSGFLIGAYMPVSTFPKAVQYFCGIMPGSYTAGICRNALLGNIMETVGEKSVIAKSVVEEYFSVNINLFNNSITTSGMWAYLGISTIILLLLNIIFVKKVKIVK